MCNALIIVLGIGLVVALLNLLWRRGTMRSTLIIVLGIGLVVALLNLLWRRGTMRNTRIIVLGIGLVVALIFNIGLQRQVQEGYVLTQKLLKLHGDEVTLRLETQASLEYVRGLHDDLSDAVHQAVLDGKEVLDALEVAYKDLRRAAVKKNEYMEAVKVAERGWEMAYYYVLDMEYGMEWLKGEATKTQIKRWFDGDWTNWNAAIRDRELYTKP